jgi:hypothetical protein
MDACGPWTAEPATVLRAADGREVMVLEEADDPALHGRPVPACSRRIDHAATHIPQPVRQPQPGRSEGLAG